MWAATLATGLCNPGGPVVERMAGDLPIATLNPDQEGSTCRSPGILTAPRHWIGVERFINTPVT